MGAGDARGVGAGRRAGRVVGSRAISDDDRFFEDLPAFDAFHGVVDAANYRPLPDDWALAVADVVGSTAAIAAGRYKAVNMAGAAVISAIQNAVGRHEIPFVFGGDGALVALAPADHMAARTALAAVQTWVTDELELGLRTAFVPVSAIRGAGHDIRVARFRVAPQVSYANFSGGGAAWADGEMKAGRFLVDAAAPGSRPDLSGLSCRWRPIESRNGTILSIIAVACAGGDAGAFQQLVGDVLVLLAEHDRDGHPVPADGPRFRWPPAGLRTESRAGSPGDTRRRRRRRILYQSAVGSLAARTARTVGGFDAARYRADTAVNSDFRKFDDGLKLTVDVSADVEQRVSALLRAASDAGVCRYGLHRQDAALMTCIVPSSLRRDHMHFVDGAAGGYAMAAAMLKSS